MRLIDPLQHPLAHAALTNIGVDQHHDQPENIEVANTTLSVEPLPGGPGTWDIPVPLNAQVAKFSFRSIHTSAEGGGKSGVHGIATRSLLEATAVSMGGHGTIALTAYNAVYSKKASAMNLSHLIFSAEDGGDYICLTDIYLTLISGTERVLRTVWTNYGSSYYTLNCWGEIQIVG